MARSILDFLLPSTCQFCHGPATAGMICDGCHASLPWNDSACPVCALPQPSGHSVTCARCTAHAPGFDIAHSAFRHEAPIANAIYGLKYHAQFAQARLLGAAMADRARARAEPLPDLLVPVPLHSGRLRWRGYNQALELAKAIGRTLPVPVDARSARRTRATADQIGQGLPERRRAVRGAFAVGAAVAGKHIALVDDVMTTGSTVDELARACRKAGATRIEVWTAARAI